MADDWRKDKGRQVIQGLRREKRAVKSKRARAGGGRAAPAPAARRVEWRQALPGFMLGMLLCIVFQRLVGQLSAYMPLFLGAAGAVLALTPLRPLLWAAVFLQCAAYSVVAYTPWTAPLVRTVVVQDSLRPADAVVVLSADIHPSGGFSSSSFARVVHGLEVLKQGYARRLVLTRLPSPKPSYLPAVRRQMRDLGMQFPIVETARVLNTHDEAVAVGRLARQSGWTRVILVSDPSHMRRGAATFRKAGLSVICSPCIETEYDIQSPGDPGARINAFRDWLHETVGYEVYRRRGWI
jgi:uncharacterized SAM-binding protein YcdF (DUF218 family)